MVKLFYSGGASNQFAITSVGGGKSTTEIPDNDLNNLWDDVNRVEVINGREEWRAFYIENDEGQDYARVRLKDIVVPPDTEIAFAVNDPNTAVQLLVTEDTTPIGLSFLPVSEYRDLKVPIGLIDDTNDIAIWMRRKVIVGSDLLRTISLVIDGIDNTITIGGDFGDVENALDNINIVSRSSQFFCDIDFVGESLLS